MKRKFLETVMIVTISVAAGWNVYQSENKIILSELGLANVEALANWEWIPGGNPPPLGTIGKQERCKLELGGGMFTSSVEYICYEQYVCPSCTCTPVPCGVVF
ncbi:hypothetical protein M2480_002795 [Parabacteroides sp. PFB2-12]|uniref:NVEALA domain-containing protein n=1 Tax=unclassified Parabacteroides TaxID=2649774 RepID=UPI002476F890|nr:MULTISPECIES: NVEALA domain-containing protein [unclassified Parabacteroides]MDH6344310.1 hypothetical protein [Parabacteroides sp. PM6-13]MDH6391793.1 hypothetical protein [Parabacteroides sp. PFB2-12]